jgi:predicted ATPase/DNA-binding SARP family transcriptional activator
VRARECGQAGVEIRILGPIEIVGKDGPVPLPAFKHRQLLAALTLNASRPCSTDALIDALWGDTPPQSARKVLRIYVSQLRKVLPPFARVHTRAAGYELELTADALDAARFERLLDEGRVAARTGNAVLAASLLRRALALWRGRAFGELAYESFVRSEAERLQEQRLTALEERIDADLDLGLHADVLPEVCRLADEEPLRERLQGQAMLTLYRCGRQAEALERYAATRALLRDQLGLEPGEDLRDLQRRILQHDPALAGRRREATPEAVLPTPPNRLVGRARELEELRRLLERDEVRLLVLTGAGGSGKTRLVLETARHAADAFANGAAFVTLAPLRDPELVIDAIARALRIEEAPSETLLETVAAALRPLELLLVLDNAEHLGDAGPLFVELLARAPLVKLLVTSRVVLHLTGEHVYPVEPLAAEPAEELFRERARASAHGFRFDETSSRAIQCICARLDGLPLAIELAAAHIRTLSPIQLLERLERRLPLLVGGPRDLPARQQTLRATLEWSFDLLHADEQRDVARLGVFSGSFDLESAQRICGTTVERLAALVDASLVRRVDVVAEARFSLLETVREHTLDLLGGDRASLEEKHAWYFLDVAEKADAQLFGADHGSVVERFDVDHDNFEAALDWFHRTEHSVDELRLAAALWYHWSARGRPTEARRRLADALNAAADDHPSRIKALHGAGTLAARQGDFTAAEQFALETQRVARDLGHARGEAQGLNVLGITAQLRGDLPAAGERFGRAATLFRRAGDRRGYGIALLNLGVVELDRGRFAASERLGHRALKIFRELDDTSDEALILGNLGLAAVERGAVDRAEAYFRQSLELAVEVRFTERIANALVGLAAVAAWRGESARAASRLGAAAAFREDAGYVPERPEAALRERAEASIRSALNADQYEALVSEARARPWDVVAEA